MRLLAIIAFLLPFIVIKANNIAVSSTTLTARNTDANNAANYFIIPLFCCFFRHFKSISHC